MEPEVIAAVRRSYGRALIHGDLMARFYELFLASDREIRDKFRDTDFDKQRELLSQSINMAILLPQGNVVARNALTRLRESHSRKRLAIAPRLYGLWTDSLIRALSEADPDFSRELERQWRELLAVTVAFMTAGYDAD